MFKYSNLVMFTPIFVNYFPLIFSARRIKGSAVLGDVILSVRLSVCVSVRLHLRNTPGFIRNEITDIFIPRVRAITLVVCHQQRLVDDVPFPLKFACKLTHVLRKTSTSTDFRLYRLTHES